MSWSWTLGRLFGIKVQMHWTFLILLAFVGIGYGASGGILAAANGIAFILALFACVVLHECGHALTAAKYGIPTQDITLLPIGGLARMERMPKEPHKEFWIAVAGPAVNVVIAAILFGILALSIGIDAVIAEPSPETPFLVNLMWVNVILVVFNMIPAFPMDGGRVLRAALATRMSYHQATRAAASVGQVLAIFFGFVGLFSNPFLVFIAIFIYLGAEAEAQMAEMSDLLQDVTVRDAMMTEYETLPGAATLHEAVDALLAGDQEDFPVTVDGQVAGMLFRKRLMEGLRESGAEAPIRNWLTSFDHQQVQPDDKIFEIVKSMREQSVDAIPVFQQGEMIGIFSLKNLSEFLMVRSAEKGSVSSAAQNPQMVGSMASSASG